MNFATESRPTVAWYELRLVTIFSDRVMICRLMIDFLKCAGERPRSLADWRRAGSSSSIVASSWAEVILIFPICKRAAHILKISLLLLCVQIIIIIFRQ